MPHDRLFKQQSITNGQIQSQKIELKLLIDCPQHLSLLARLWHEEIIRHWHSDVLIEQTTKNLAQHLNREQLPISIVALHEHIPVGMACLRDNTLGIQPGIMPWLGSLVVEPAYRENGIGEMLIEAVKIQAQSFDHNALHLLSIEKKLSNWYRNLGWKIIGEDSMYGYCVDVMSISLKPFSAHKSGMVQI